MQGEEKHLPLPTHIDLMYVHCNVLEKLGFILRFLCLKAFGAQAPYSCKLINGNLKEWELWAVHKSGYLAYILLQMASFSTEGIWNILQRKEWRRNIQQ